MDNQILTNLSIITSFHNKGKSVIDTFLPIVEYGIATLNIEKENNHYDLQSLQEQIEKSIGIKINTLSLKSLLRKLETSNLIKLLEKGKYFSINEKNKPEQDKYIEAQREQYRNVHKFVRAYKSYSKDERDESAINEWIFSFIKDYRQLINVDKNDITISCITEDSEKYKSLIEFLKEINECDNDLVKSFSNIYFGYNLYSILETNSTLNDIRFNNLTIYLDSNFILRLFDLQESNFTKETTELFSILKANNTKLVIFEETIVEIKSVLLYYLDIYKSKQHEYKTLLDNPEYINGVLGAYFRRNLTFTQIEDIINSISLKIKEYGISTDNIKRFRITTDDKEVEKLYREKYYDKFDDNEDEYRKQKAEHYIQIINIITFQRKVNQFANASCLANCGYIFLTCDLRLYNYNKKNSKRAFIYPNIITQEVLANDLLLFEPQDIGKVSIGLMVSLFNASKYIDVHILDNLSQAVQEIAVTSPEETDYVIMATRNSEHYSEINKIYADNEIDPKSALIELGQKVKEKEQQKDENFKTQLQEKESSIIEMKKAHEQELKEKDSYICKLEDEKQKAVKELANIKKSQIETTKRAFSKKFKVWTVVYHFTSILLCIIATLASSVGTVFSIIVIPSQTKWLAAILCIIVTIAAIFGAICKGWDNKIIEKLIAKKKTKLMKKYNLTEDDLIKTTTQQSTL